MKNKMIYLGLSGATGRMGRAVQAAVRQKKSGFVIQATWPLQNTGKATGLNKIDEVILNGNYMKSIDAVIDFSAPKLLEWTLKQCVLHKVPLVSGTTGLTWQQNRYLKAAAKKIPVFYEANMSWGIWLIKNWIKNILHPSKLAILIEDIHHKNKKDKPSGTALQLMQSFSPARQKAMQVKSLRKGQEFGTHRVHFKAEDEILTIEHQALNRSLFAKGALRIIPWLILQKPGFYCLDNYFKELKRR